MFRYLFAAGMLLTVPASVAAEVSADVLAKMAISSPNQFVREVQIRLGEGGYYSGQVSGLLTPATIKSINRLCRKAGTLASCQEGPLSAGGSAAIVAALSTLKGNNETVATEEPAPADTLAAPDAAEVENESQPQLGPNVIVNGGFDSDLSGWTINDATISGAWDAGSLQITRERGGIDGAPRQNISLVAGRKYELRAVVSDAPAAMNVEGTDRMSVQLPVGETVLTVSAGRDNAAIVLWSFNQDSVTRIDDISLREIAP